MTIKHKTLLLAAVIGMTCTVPGVAWAGSDAPVKVSGTDAVKGAGVPVIALTYLTTFPISSARARSALAGSRSTPTSRWFPGSLG